MCFLELLLQHYNCDILYIVYNENDEKKSPIVIILYERVSNLILY